MAKKASIFEAESDEEIEAWHDNAYSEYQAALDAYQKDISRRRAKGDGAGFDPTLRKKYEDTRDTLQTAVTYWRQVGEQCGVRTGVAVVDNVFDPEDEE